MFIYKYYHYASAKELIFKKKLTKKQLDVLYKKNNWDKDDWVETTKIKLREKI